MAPSEESDQSGVSRRTVVRGAAWTGPVVAVGATAPAYAASRIPCPVVPPASQWSPTTITSGTASSKVDGYSWSTSDDKWVIYKDNSVSSSTSLVFETRSAPFPVTPGSTNSGTFTFSWGYGNSSAQQSAAGTFQILLNGATVLTTVSRPGTPLVTTTQTVSFTAPPGKSTATLTYRYTIEPQNKKPASDDIVVGLVSFGSCMSA